MAAEIRRSRAIQDLFRRRDSVLVEGPVVVGEREEKDRRTSGCLAHWVQILCSCP